MNFPQAKSTASQLCSLSWDSAWLTKCLWLLPAGLAGPELSEKQGSSRTLRFSRNLFKITQNACGLEAPRYHVSPFPNGTTFLSSSAVERVAVNH